MGKKRRNFTTQFKFEAIMEGLRGDKLVSQICCERDIIKSLYYKWRDTFAESRFLRINIEILKKAGSKLPLNRRRNER